MQGPGRISELATERQLTEHRNVPERPRLELSRQPMHDIQGQLPIVAARHIHPELSWRKSGDLSRQIGRLMVLDLKRASQIGQRHGERGTLHDGDEQRSRIGDESRMTRRAAPDRRAEIAVLDESKRCEQRKPVGYDGAAELRLPFDIQPGRRLPRPDQIQDRRQTCSPRVQCPGAASATRGGALGQRLWAFRSVSHRLHLPHA